MSKIVEKIYSSEDEMLSFLRFQKLCLDYTIEACLTLYEKWPESPYFDTIMGFQKSFTELRPEEKGNGIDISLEQKVQGIMKGNTFYPLSALQTEDIQDVLEGKIGTVTDIFIEEATVYTIMQTNCPPSEYSRLFQKRYGMEELPIIYSILQSAAAYAGIQTEETDMNGLSLTGYCQGSKIFINSNYSIYAKFEAFLKHYAAVLTTETSNNAEIISAFEKMGLYCVMLDKYNLEKGNSLAARIEKPLKAVMSCAYLNKQESLARIHRRAQFERDRYRLVITGLAQGGGAAPDLSISAQLADEALGSSSPFKHRKER